MEPEVFMDQQRAHDEACLMIEGTNTLQRREHAFEAFHEALVPQPQVFQVPTQAHQALRSIAVGEIGVKDDDFGERAPRGTLLPQETRIQLGLGRYMRRWLAR